MKNDTTNTVYQHEARSILGIALIYAFRMLGLFMILPIFSVYAANFSGATPLLIGIGLGIYGLTQGILQIPFGLISDKIGRKPVIFAGLILFMFGSIIAAYSHSIYGIIVGRAMQGCGAVGSTLAALLADLTREQHRTKAMGVLGITIGFAFTLAMMLGPLLNAWIGLNGIFALTALLAGLGLIILFAVVPHPSRLFLQRDAEAIPKLFKSLLRDPQMQRLNFSVFCLHALLTANFIAIPILLNQEFALSTSNEWLLYLPVIIISFVFVFPLIIISEKRRIIKPILLISIALLLLTQILWLIPMRHIFYAAIVLIIYFTVFNFLEASLPSLLSKRAPAGSKGTALGIFSTCQFLGIFFGGLLGGWLLTHDLAEIFYGAAVLSLLWLAFGFTMESPRYLSSEVVNLGQFSVAEFQFISQKLKQTLGIADVLIDEENRVAYLKIDKKQIDPKTLEKLLELT